MEWAQSRDSKGMKSRWRGAGAAPLPTRPPRYFRYPLNQARSSKGSFLTRVPASAGLPTGR